MHVPENGGTPIRTEECMGKFIRPNNCSTQQVRHGSVDSTNHSIRSLTDHASRRQPTMTKAVSKIAASGMIRVIVGQRFSFKKNINGERNGVNPETSTQPATALMRSASRFGVVMVSPCVVFGGLRRAHRASARRSVS
jgi:hypothetical protein